MCKPNYKCKLANTKSVTTNKKLYRNFFKDIQMRKLNFNDIIGK